MRGNMTMPLIRTLVLLLAASLAGCAAVQHRPAVLAPAPAATPRVLAVAADFTLDTGFSRHLKAGSRWLQQGTVPQGDVYKPWQDVFMLEGAHVHEAWLVVRDDRLVGFYLPAERGFSSLAPAIPLRFQY